MKSFLLAVVTMGCVLVTGAVAQEPPTGTSESPAPLDTASLLERIRARHAGEKSPSALRGSPSNPALIQIRDRATELYPSLRSPMARSTRLQLITDSQRAAPLREVARLLANQTTPGQLRGALQPVLAGADEETRGKRLDAVLLEYYLEAHERPFHGRTSKRMISSRRLRSRMEAIAAASALLDGLRTDSR